jgi:hypothetical protein
MVVGIWTVAWRLSSVLTDAVHQYKETGSVTLPGVPLLAWVRERLAQSQ